MKVALDVMVLLIIGAHFAAGEKILLYKTTSSVFDLKAQLVY